MTAGPAQVILRWLEVTAVTDEACAMLAAGLPADDVARADRLVRPVDRHRRLLASVLLRWSLGPGGATAVLDRRCRRCGHQDHGKPTLTASIDFSLSHGGAWVVVAVVDEPHMVGVDVERVDRGIDEVGLDRHFGAAVAGIAGTRPLETWVRLEAVGKATGAGIVAPPVLQPTAVPGRFRGEHGTWALTTITPDDAHVAAVAVSPPAEPEHRLVRVAGPGRSTEARLTETAWRPTCRPAPPRAE